MPKRLTTKQFIDRSNKVHKEKYDYSLVEYKNSQTKVKIICKEHGVFEQKPYSHLQGHKCPLCSNIQRAESNTYSQEYFIKESTKIHKGFYNYSKVVYKGNRDKVKIICQLHGEFEQTPFAHMQGQGCTTCFREKQSKGNYGGTWSYKKWAETAKKSKRFDSFKVYIIRCWNDDEEFYKIGKTFKTLSNRYAGIKMPYNYEILSIIENKCGIETSKLEDRLQKENKQYKYVPKIKFAGMYECFSKLKVTKNQ